MFALSLTGAELDLPSYSLQIKLTRCKSFCSEALSVPSRVWNP
jgi:hypothetical protein